MRNDWQTFCSSRGAGLTDFATEKPWRPKSLVLETDPPLHDRTRRVLNGVLSASAMSRLRERYAPEQDRLVGRQVASIEITGPPRRRYNNTLRALASLPVTFKPG